MSVSICKQPGTVFESIEQGQFFTFEDNLYIKLSSDCAAEVDKTFTRVESNKTFLPSQKNIRRVKSLIAIEE